MRILTDAEVLRVGVSLRGTDEDCVKAARNLFGIDVATDDIEGRIVRLLKIDICCNCGIWIPACDLDDDFFCGECQEASGNA
jgi:hypothetical protein